MAAGFEWGGKRYRCVNLLVSTNMLAVEPIAIEARDGKMGKFLGVVFAACILTACGSVPIEQQPITSEQRDFTYDFVVAGKSKDDLFVRANDYLAVTYGNSKLISRVEDPSRGTIIGKAISNWGLTTDSFLIPQVPCYSNYDIYFVSKDGKARLQLSLVEGAPLPSSCGWRLPPKRDYPQIVTQFNSIAKGLGDALNGRSVIDKISDF